jgi:hypothetical protein
MCASSATVDTMLGRILLMERQVLVNASAIPGTEPPAIPRLLFADCATIMSMAIPDQEFVAPAQRFPAEVVLEVRSATAIPAMLHLST